MQDHGPDVRATIRSGLALNAGLPQAVPAVRPAAFDGQLHIGLVKALVQNADLQVIGAFRRVRRDRDGAIAQIVTGQPGSKVAARTAGTAWGRSTYSADAQGVGRRTGETR